MNLKSYEEATTIVTKIKELRKMLKKMSDIKTDSKRLISSLTLGLGDHEVRFKSQRNISEIPIIDFAIDYITSELKVLKEELEKI